MEGKAMAKCIVCGKDEMFHSCSETGQTIMGAASKPKKRGFMASAKLALDIFTGSLRLLWRYPVLIVPLLPVFVMVLGFEVALLVILGMHLSLFWAWVLLFMVAYYLMFSFVLTSTMLKQIHSGERPSLWKSLTAPSTPRLAPSVFVLTAIWFALVLVLVAIETAVKAVVSRGGDRAVGYVDQLFDTFASALRMMGFMLIPIMVFENVGLRSAYGRLKTTLKTSPISALSGLALTKMASVVIFLLTAVFFSAIDSLDQSTAAFALLLGLPVAGVGWMFAMYLEQLFATGLYLYSAAPDSVVVKILLEKHIGRELPAVPLPQPLG
jgi:hypothetical protein